MPSQEEAYYAQPYGGNRWAITRDQNDALLVEFNEAEKFLNHDRRNGVKVFGADAFLEKGTPDNDWNVPDSPDAWKKVVNKVVLLTNGLKSVTVTSLITNIGTKNDGLEAMSLAWDFLLGRRSPTGIVDIKVMMKKLAGKKFQALVYGVRTGNEKCTTVKTYIYSDDPAVRMAIAELKDTFEPVLPIVFVDPTNCKDACSTSCVSKNNEELWMCRLKEEFKCYLKTFKVPAEDGQLSIFPYLLSIMVRGKPVPPGQQQPMDVVDADVDVLLVDLCNPEGMVCGKVFPRVIDGSYTHFRFLASEAFSHFLCWLVSKETTLDGATVNKWNICGYESSSNEFDIASASIITQENDVTKKYVFNVHKTMTVLKGLLNFLLPDNAEDRACYGVVLCKKQDLDKHIKCVIDKAKDLYAKENDLKDTCILAGLKAAMSTVTSHFVEFVNLLHDAVNGAAFPTSVGKKLTYALCKMVSHVVPWYYATVKHLEVFWTAVMLTHMRVDACVTRLVVPSVILEKKQMALELARQAPELFKDGQTEPRMSDLKDLVAKRPDSTEAVLAAEYMKLDTHLAIQRRAAEYDLSMAEIQEAETNLCDVLAWAVSKKIVSDAERSATLKWIFGVFEDFRRTALTEDHKLIQKALKRRKEKDEQLRKMLRDAIKAARSSLELLNEVMLSVGYNPVTDQLLEKKASDALRIQGISALLAAKGHGDERIVTSLSQGMRYGTAAGSATADALASVAQVFKKSPKGPYNRTSQFDGEAYPYSQSFLPGVSDEGYWLPVSVNNLASNYISIFH